MKIKYLFFLVASLCCMTELNAQSKLKVTLKNGSELVGFISRQSPGEHFTLSTSSANIFISQQEVKSMIDTEVNYNTLSKEWQEWADQNDAVSGFGDNRTVTLSDIITDKGTINRVRVVERGAKIRYIELTPNSYVLQWDTLSIVKCDPRPKLLLSGVNRRYKLKSGKEYEGQYVEEVPGKTVSLYCDNGITEVFNTIDVVKDNRIKINPNQSILEQSDLIDIVQLKNGRSLRGIILERNYFGFDDMDSVALSKSNNKLIQNDFLLIQQEDNSIKSVNLTDISEYRKELNPQYKPLTDILLQDGAYVLNRENVTPVSIKEENNTLTFNQDSIITIPAKPTNVTPITIETRLANESQSQQFKLVKCKSLFDKRSKASFYTFSYEDLVKSSYLPIKVETSVNHTTRFEYEVFFPGAYVFYNPINNVAIPFLVK